MVAQPVVTPVVVAALRDGQSYLRYQQLTDAHEAVTVQVPSTWVDVETARWTYLGRDVGVYIAASRDLGEFLRTGQEAGVFVGVSQPLGQTSSVADLLTREQGIFGAGCRHDGRHSYADRFYTGEYDTFSCPGRISRLVAAVLGPGARYTVLLRMTVTSRADIAAASRILATFQVIDGLDSDHHDD